MGPEMMQEFRDQAERFGTRFITDNVTKLEPGAEGEPHTVWVDDDEYKARAVILAMGAEHKKLGVPGEEELGGRGVSYCATCDAAFFKDRDDDHRRRRRLGDGGGDLPRQVLARKVTIVNRRDEFRASKIMLERARATENIEFLTPVRRRRVRCRRGRRARTRDAAQHRDRRDARAADVRRASSRSATSRSPSSSQGIVETDENGYVVTEGKSTRTNVPGVFAAGDLVDHTYRQAVTAAGSGCQAALDAEWYLRDNPTVPTPAALDGHRRPRRGAVGPGGAQPARPSRRRARPRRARAA